MFCPNCHKPMKKEKEIFHCLRCGYTSNGSYIEKGLTERKKTELERYLELSRDETAIKAFYKLGSFFTAKKYEINNNVFNLIKHQEEAETVAKKVILKKMVAWEIRK